MDLAKRDIRIDILKQVLAERNKFLMDKNKEIQRASKDNTFLVEVAEDYSKYYKTIKKQKLEQQTAFEILSKYISDTATTIDQTKEALRHSETHQQQIMSQIERLRKEIDEII